MRNYENKCNYSCLQCIDSIIAQTYKDLEIILVDDGSTDNSAVICDEYKKICSNIVVLHQENSGVVLACKAGANIATGEYIAFIDSDDYIEADYVNNFYLATNNGTIDIVCSNLFNIFNNKLNLIKFSDNEGVYQIDDYILERILVDKNSHSKMFANSRWNKLIKTSIVNDALNNCLDNISYAEDQQFTIECVSIAKSINIINYVGYNYRVTPNSLEHQYKKDLWLKDKILINSYISNKNLNKISNWTTQVNTYLIICANYCIAQELCYKNKNYKQIIKEIISDPLVVCAFLNYYPKSFGVFDKVFSKFLKHKKMIFLPLVKSFYFFYTKIKSLRGY